VAAPLTKPEHVRVLLVRYITDDIVYSNNPRKEDDLKMAFKKRLSSVSPAGFRRAINSVFVTCGKCVPSSIKPFIEHSLQRVSKNAILTSTQ
jgi:hypothetical protein